MVVRKTSSKRKAKRHRWVCPICGVGALGSSRPRKNATVRYCLACSAKSEYLVERSAPALAKKRSAVSQAKATQRKKRVQRAEAKETERWTFGSIDLRKEADRICKRFKIRKPNISLRIGKSWGCSGRSHGGRVTMTVYEKASGSEALALLIHELAHEANPWSGHRSKWRATFVEMAETYGVPVGSSETKAQIHRAVEVALKKALGE